MRVLAAAALLVALLGPATARSAPTVTVDGRPLPSLAVLETGDGDGDAQVIAAAFLRLSGAVIEGGDQFLEAWFPGGILSLSAGSAGYQWNAMPGRLSAPTTTSPDGEIVCRASDLARILGMQGDGLAFTTTSSAALHSRQAMAGMEPSVAEAPGLLPVSMDTAFSDATVFDAPPPAGSEVPADVLPATGPPTGTAATLVSFRAGPDPATPNQYRLQTVISNPGPSDLVVPVEVQYLETGSTDEAFEIMGSDLVRTLPAGQSVSLDKCVAMTAATPRFRAMLLTVAPSGLPLVVGSLDATP